MPIWDSRVDAYLTRNCNFNTVVNTVAKFEKYIVFLDKIIETNQFKKIYGNVIPKMQTGNLNKIQISNYRILEQLMFHKQLEYINKTKELKGT